MNINEININNRVEIHYYDIQRFKLIIKGIVMNVNENIVEIITENGERLILEKNKILFVDRVNFERVFSERLNSLKNFYIEVFELEKKIEDLLKNEEFYKERVRESYIMNNANIGGLVNYLNNEILDKTFFKNKIKTEISFDYNEGEEDNIYINFICSNKFSYMEIHDKEELHRILDMFISSDIKNEIKEVFELENLYIKTKKVETLEEDYIGIICFEGIYKLDKTKNINLKNTFIEKIQKMMEVKVFE